MKIRIGLADDHQLFLKSLSLMLESLQGFEVVVEALNGADLQEKLPQKKELLRGTDIIVATPGRLLDHMEQRTVDLSAVQILTLDEADRMLDMGFLPPLRRILKVLPRERQTLLFSATISPEVVKLSADFTRDPQRVDVSEGQVMASTVTHRVHPVTEQRTPSER